MATFDFPGEKYLLEDLPDYGSERQMLIVKFFLIFVLWTMIVPSFLASEKDLANANESGNGNRNRNRNNNASTDQCPRETRATTTTTKSSSKTTRKTTTTTTIVKVQHRKTQKKAISAKKQIPNTTSKNIDSKNVQKESTQATTSDTVKVVDLHTNLLCLFAFVLHAIYLLVMASPDNYYTSRTIFETPLFSQSECDYLVDMAERVAGTNYEIAQKFVQTNSAKKDGENNQSAHTTTTMMGYLKEPYGWQKTRHKFHPTTDLNLVTDNFTDEDRAWIQQKLDARLAPTLERIFGVPPSAIRANDVSTGDIGFA